MNIHAPTRMTVATFLKWVEGQPEGKYELVDGVPVAMSPERIRHSTAKSESHAALRSAIARAKLSCQAWVDGPLVQTGRRFGRIPDVVVQCGPSDPDSMVADNPVIVLEVISLSSRRVDLSDKLEEYFAVASIRHYLIVKPEKRVVIHHARDEAGQIHTRIVTSGRITLSPPGISVACKDLLGPAE